ncbi:hypothetical protein JCM5350_005120 [Sporobolomyces pararoseus]
MAVTEVYEAYDDYDEEEEYYEGGEGEEYWINDQTVEEVEEEADEDEFGPGVTICWTSKPRKQEVPVSEVDEAAYLDPLGLVNCWEEALVDLKAAHPDRFFPPSEAPRSFSQRQSRAPLWHGPSTTPNPAPIASTSKLSAAQVATVQCSAPSLSPDTLSYSMAPMPGNSAEPPTKKRKRLTGSQKKARKAAKLANNPEASSSTAYHSGKVLNPAQTSKGKSREEEEDTRSQSPGYEPQSPNLAPPSLPTEATSSLSAVIDRHLPPHLSSSRATAQASPAQSQNGAAASTSQVSAATIAARAPPPPSAVLSRLPLSFPSPPPITPLTGQEPALEPETSESLLESALWSWYTAGYQTALYHASVGVATFKPSEPNEKDSQE